jgi:hypothetical protein
LNLLNLTIKRNLLGELIMNKKIVMPKVFDEWDYEEHECCDFYEMKIEKLNFNVFQE